MIKKVAIVGMGALGMMYGEHIQNSCCAEVGFIMDAARLKRHQHDTFSVNGKEIKFQLLSTQAAKPVDLLIFATKFNGIDAALDEAAGFVGENTIIFSVLNGISSEEKIYARFGAKNLLHCVALGMDAVRKGSALTYQHKGMLKIGTIYQDNIAALNAVCSFFDMIQLPYSREEDIMHALWAKLLLNVGINQTCMIYATNYGGAFSNEEARTKMYAAMHEVILVAQAEGIQLTEADFESCVKVLKTLSPIGVPSMRQDGLAKRKSEVELFAGTIVRLGEKHKLSVPVNAEYYRKVQEIEANYQI